MKFVSAALFASTLASILLFHIPAAEASSEKVVYSFQGNGIDGGDPVAGLLDVKGTLYGTTYLGGTYYYGSVFEIDPATGTEKMLYSFGGSETDGFEPHASLIDVKKTLYGTTVAGGAYGQGTIFKIDPATGIETVLYSFGSNGNDSATPDCDLLYLNGALYGTASEGGYLGWGTVFKIDPTTGTETIVYSFGSNDMDGAFPAAGLLDVNGTLYGTTVSGGAYGFGTVFQIDAINGVEQVLYSFGSHKDGRYPYADLVSTNGTLYGTTTEGGTYDHGTVFSINPATGTEIVLHSFKNNSSGGASPYGKLLDVNGSLYGTTRGGYPPPPGFGTVFKIDPATGALTLLHAFKKIGDGREPWSSLIKVKGTLYGTTQYGGTYGAGTVFKIKP